MFVGLKMLKMDEFITINPNSLVRDAEKLMLANNTWMLLVEDKGKLVGYVTKEDVKEALPSRANTLSKTELNYVLAELSVEKLIRRDVPTIGPGEEIETAAYRMTTENMHGLAVVDDNKKLLGFINRSVLLNVFAEEMGLGLGGSRVVVNVKDKVGVLCSLTSLIKDMGYNIFSLTCFQHGADRMVVFRINADDLTPVHAKLKEAGYEVVTSIEDVQ